jgi:hypothetical protein
MKHGLPILLFAAACTAPTSGVAIDPATSCGAGTREEAGVCVRDTTYQLAVADAKMGADGRTRHEVLVLGTHADGSPATDQVVFNTDRSGAGGYRDATRTLGPLGATTYFTPCDQAVAGCLGPLSLTVALASAPATPVAHADVTLVDPIQTNPAAACLGGGNVLHFEGNDTIYTGALTVTDAAWQLGMYSDNATIVVTPTDPAQGSSWRLELEVTKIGGVFVDGARYEDAQRLPWEDVDHPGMLVSGNGHTCNTIAGSFVVQDYDGYPPAHLTASFEQHCEGSATTKLTGCVHYQQ